MPYDEVFRNKFTFVPHESSLVRELTQPSEGLILERNAEARKDNVFGDLSFGRMVASIPFIMWDKAKRNGYDLDSPDPVVREQELNRFLRSEDGKLCMVRSDHTKYHQGGI